MDRSNRKTTPLRAQLKAQAVAYMGGRCFDCQLETDISAVYDFHHVDPKSKEYSLAALLAKMRPVEEIQQELDKCVMLCANCHRIRHHLRHKAWVAFDTLGPQAF